MKNQIQQILSSTNLDAQRALISELCTELSIDSLSCAAALLSLMPSKENLNVNTLSPPRSLTASNATGEIKMIRYRLDVGSKQQITADQLRKVLIEESGVDKKNINNIHIHSLYTLLELPDEMPPDIFQHLKSVEINQQKLDIRRVKNNNKRRGNNYIRRGRKRDNKPINTETKPDNQASD